METRLGNSGGTAHTLLNPPPVWSRVRAQLGRGIYLVSVFAFLLPFVTVRSCESSTTTEYSGFQLIGRDGGWILLFPICLALALFGLSFLRPRGNPILQGFLKSWKAFGSSVAGAIVLFFPSLQFLFDTVTPKIGQYVSGACWGLVYIATLTIAVKAVLDVRRTPTSSPGRYGGFILLHILHYVVGLAIGVLVLIASVGWIRSSSTAADTYVPLYALSIPTLLGLYFGLQGLKNKERWSLIWGTVLSSLLLVGGILSSLFLAQSDDWFRLAVTTSISGFLAIVLWDSVGGLKG